MKKIPLNYMEENLNKNLIEVEKIIFLLSKWNKLDIVDEYVFNPIQIHFRAFTSIQEWNSILSTYYTVWIFDTYDCSFIIDKNCGCY